MSLDPALTPNSVPPTEAQDTEAQDLDRRVADLRQQETALKQELATLQRQVAEAQQAMGRIVKEGLSDMEQRRQTLQISIEQLERRQDRIRTEMKTTFAGASQDLAIRVQGFKDYLVGSLQDLVTATEQLPLMTPASGSSSPDSMVSESAPVNENRRREPGRSEPGRSELGRSQPSNMTTLRFTESEYQAQAQRINRLLDQYRLTPDYYGAPWQLRRTFEPVHAERVSNWLFAQNGRGALKTMGSRLQNILIASAVISVLKDLQGDRLRVLVLGNSPERLGEWRRGLQDCLGISRADFGADQGVVLFDAPEPLVQRADRLVRQNQLPFILIDESEGVVDIALLQFPLWLAFAPDPANPMLY
jgi:hypothetical protein